MTSSMSNRQKSKRSRVPQQPSPTTQLSLAMRTLRHQKPLVSYILLHQVPHRLLVAGANLAQMEVQVDSNMRVNLPQQDEPTLLPMQEDCKRERKRPLVPTMMLIVVPSKLVSPPLVLSQLSREGIQLIVKAF